VKPIAFEYHRASSVREAVDALASRPGEAKVIAGGQSLVPMMNFRLVRPALVVDINRIPELQRFEETRGGGLRLGALTRHTRIVTSSEVARLFPMLRHAISHVGHLAIRNRGTVGGSLSHADPATEWPCMSLLLEARLRAVRPGGERIIDAKDFFVSSLTTCLEADELLVDIELPALEKKTGWAFEEVARRAGDFALAAVAVLLTTSWGKVASVRVAAMGVADRPTRLGEVERLIKGKAVSESLLAEAAECARHIVQPTTDLHASADFRRHLAAVLMRRTLDLAWRRARGETP
jgi:CO/xanthine dehydrogenase FAD-binding subunit